MLTLLNMKTGPYDFDIQIDENEDVHVIEMGPRNGGGWLPKVIQYATGVDLIEYTIKAALGEDCSDLTMAKTKGYWSNYLINSADSGVFNGVEFDTDFEKNHVVEYELFVEKGDRISALTGGNAGLGIMLLKFSSMEEMVETMENMANFVKVKVGDTLSLSSVI